MSLAPPFGILLPEALASGEETEIDDIPALLLTKAYGDREDLVAKWLFFREAPLVIPRAREDGAALLFRMRANGLLPGDVEAKLDRTRLAPIPFPETAGAPRRSFTPREDVALDVAVRKGTSEVLVLRLVRARRGKATVHAILGKAP